MSICIASAKLPHFDKGAYWNGTTGKNFSDYLKEIRIENAKNMLLNTEQQVEDISFAVGYSDIKYFSRLFKKLTGVTPTEFRRLYN